MDVEELTDAPSRALDELIARATTLEVVDSGTSAAVASRPATNVHRAAPRWVKVIDQTRCIGCHACTTACKSENESRSA